MNNPPRAWTLACLLALPIFLARLAFSSMQSNTNVEADNRYFPETGRSIKGTFRDYWESHGGLPQQGYPISEEMQEKSATDGKTYLVQYFERAVFELHPENAPPYDVLLSLVGVFQYTQTYSKGAPDQRASTQRPRNFIETGKTLGGTFRDYWESHGGLPQQGYPISNEFTERSDLDGKTYLVQYFERAVFELHPENAPPYDVLLSQLGKSRYDARYKASPQYDTPYIVTKELNSFEVASAGKYIFYIRKSTGTISNSATLNDLYGFDVQRQEEFLVSNSPGLKTNLATDGASLVWGEEVSSGRGDIHVFDIRIRKETLSLKDKIPVQRNLGGQLAIDKDVLYYTDFATHHTGLYKHNLMTGGETLISMLGWGPVAVGGRVLWSEQLRKDGAGDEFSLKMMDLTDATPTVITSTDKLFSGYDMSGDRVVWGFGQQIYHLQIFVRDLKTQSDQLIVDEGLSPLIGGDLIVWRAGNIRFVHGASGGVSIEGYDLENASAKTLVQTSEKFPAAKEILDGRLLVFTIGGEATLSQYLCILRVK